MLWGACGEVVVSVLCCAVQTFAVKDHQVSYRLLLTSVVVDTKVAD